MLFKNLNPNHHITLWTVLCLALHFWFLQSTHLSLLPWLLLLSHRLVLFNILEIVNYFWNLSLPPNKENRWSNTSLNVQKKNFTLPTSAAKSKLLFLFHAYVLLFLAYSVIFVLRVILNIYDGLFPIRLSGIESLL